MNKIIFKNLPFKSYQHYAISNNGIVQNNRTNKKLKPISQKSGHERIMLCEKQKKTRFLIHRLVALMFLPNPKNFPFVCHNDSNPYNNHISNLRWDNAFGNMKDRKNRGLYLSQQGEKNNASKLKPSQVKKIRKMVLEKIPRIKIAKIFKISYGTIGDIFRHHSWSHI